MAAWKIASGEINNFALLDAAAATGRPVLLSTGMSPLAEVDAAVERVRGHGVPLAVLQCSSLYPCPPELVGLNVISEFRARYGCAVGLSNSTSTRGSLPRRSGSSAEMAHHAQKPECLSGVVVPSPPRSYAS